ncbi:DUF6770 family protein [Ferruginibacter sp. SUN002]|uniref:DUF6770 family protein n=1 Tax=Ferruginibacter sp. SUN002 TaxID=2937789 RepID=UPI003D362513
MKKITLTLLTFFVCFNVFSQSKVFDNVVDVELQSSVEITNNKQIVGYALFYKIDKMKKSALYRLSILDENLKEIGSNEFEGGKDLLLVRAVYESSHLLLSFYDEDKYSDFTRFVKVFDLKGKETGMVPYDPEKVKKGMFGAAVAAQMEMIYDGTDNIEGKGFVTVYQSKAKTGGIDVQMIDVNGKLKWEKNITADKGDRADLYLLATTPNTILFFEMDRGSVMARDAEIFLVGLSVADGKQLFKKPMDINGITYEPMLIKKSTDNKLKIVSTMANAEAKFANAKPIGFSIGELNDLTGEIKTIKDFNYQNDLSSVLEMKSASKSEDGYIKAHDILMMQDGSMVLVGEFFRKTVSAGGMAMKLLSKGNASAAQATIEDMFLLRLGTDLKAKSLEKIEKDKERVPMPTDGLPIGLMARILTYSHSFGYMYTDEGLDGRNKTILAKGSFGEEKYGTVALTIDEKKGYTTKRFSLEKEKKVSYYVLRGKPGYVMIMKYNSKEKQITTNLEKVN